MKKLVRPRWGHIRITLWLRCGGRCEISGLPLDYDTFHIHHRRNKGMGGTRRADRDSLANLLALDPGVHNGGPHSVHARRDWATRHGYLIPKESRIPPSAIRVLVTGRRWVLLTSGGRYVDAS